MELELKGTDIPARIRQMTRGEADTAIAWAATRGGTPACMTRMHFTRPILRGFFLSKPKAG